MNRATLPMPVRAKPFAHQRAAFDFVCAKFGIDGGVKSSDGVALLMEMGCGKTLVAVAVAAALYRYGYGNRVLVAAPLSILGVWRDEFTRFADAPVEVSVLEGSTAKKKAALAAISDDDRLRVVVVNYESAWRMEKELLAFHPTLVIADEAHKIKETRTAQSRAMHRIGDRAPFKLLLTGTVITNRELDVYSQYRFLNSRVFGNSFYAFRNRYFDMVGYGNHIPRFRKHMTDEFLQRLHSVAYRVTKDECLDLPEVTEEIRTVELEPAAMKLYQELERDSYTQLADSEVSAVNVLTRLLRLSQITGGHLTGDDGANKPVSAAKLDALADIIDSVIAGDGKLVVIARFAAELDDIQKLLERKGVGYAVVRGGVRDRDEEIRRFQEDAGCRVFLGQIAAAGLGITLTAASTMVFYSLDYSMSNFEQAKARIHRAGQKRNCHYIYLVADDTVDTKVIKALRDKADLAKTLVDDYRWGRNPFREESAK